jgi:hypothetical protein
VTVVVRFTDADDGDPAPEAAFIARPRRYAVAFRGGAFNPLSTDMALQNQNRIVQMHQNNIERLALPRENLNEDGFETMHYAPK